MGHVGFAGGDVAVFVDPEQNGAAEAVVLGEDAREHGQGFLGTVFVVGGDEHEVLAESEAFVALVDQGTGGGFSCVGILAGGVVFDSRLVARSAFLAVSFHFERVFF